MFGSRKKSADFKFDLGDEVVDTITGFEGIVKARTQWLHNCNVYTVQPRELKDGKPVESSGFDEPQLKLKQPKKVPASRKTGGPTPAVTQTNR